MKREKIFLVLALVILLFVPKLILAKTLYVNEIPQRAEDIALEGETNKVYTEAELCAGGGDFIISSVETTKSGESIVDPPFAPRPEADGGVFKKVAVTMNGIQKGDTSSLLYVPSDDKWKSTLGAGENYFLDDGNCVSVAILGNMSDDFGSETGKIVSLSLTGISANYEAGDSIIWTGYTEGTIYILNSSQEVGTVYVSPGVLNPSEGESVEVGQTKIFASIQASVSGDSVSRSIIFSLGGTTDSGNVQNVAVKINDEQFPSVEYFPRKYYSVIPANFLAGESLDISFVAKVTGGDGSTIAFNISEATNLNFRNTDDYGMDVVGEEGSFGDRPWFEGPTANIILVVEPPEPPPTPTFPKPMCTMKLVERSEGGYLLKWDTFGDVTTFYLDGVQKTPVGEKVVFPKEGKLVTYNGKVVGPNGTGTCHAAIGPLPPAISGLLLN